MDRMWRRSSACALFAVILTPACSKDNADAHVRKGDGYVQQALLKEAVIEYRSAIQTAPRRGDVRLKLADTLMLQSDAAGALREYVRAADLLPKDATAQLKAGAMLLASGAFEDAKSRADKAIAIDPKNATAQILRGNALAGLKDVDAALAEYQEALALNPAHDAAYRNIALIQASRGHQAEAEASFRKAVDAAPNSIDAHLALASFLWANNRTEEAETILKRAQSLEPANVAANRALAMLYVSTNRPADAEPYFKAIATTLKTTSASFALADYYVLTKRFEEARKILNDLASKTPSHAAALIRLAAVAAAQGNRAQATSTLRDVVEQRPKESAARVLLARLLLEDGKYDEALAQATQAAQDGQTSPSAADAYFLIGTIHAANDRREDAVVAFEEVLKRQAQPFAADVALADLYYSVGNLDKASTYTRQALTIQPKDASARSLFVRILAAQKDFAAANETLATLQKDFPNSVGVLELEGVVQSAEGKPDAAHASFAKAAATRPDDLRILSDLVGSDLAAGRRAEAVKRVEAALKSQRSEELLLMAAATYALAGKSDNAEEMLTQAIELEPTRMQPYLRLAGLYVAQNRLAEARERFEQVVQRNPKSVASLTVLGIVLERQHHGPEAEKRYKAALAIDPQAGVAANNLAWMYVTNGGNLDEALQLAQTAQRVMPDDANVNDTLGWIYYKKHMIEQAVRHLELSTQKGPTDPARHYHLGMAYVQTGDFDKAKKSLQRALAINSAFDGADEARKALAQVGGS